MSDVMWSAVITGLVMLGVAWIGGKLKPNSLAEALSALQTENKRLYDRITALETKITDYELKVEKYETEIADLYEKLGRMSGKKASA